MTLFTMIGALLIYILTPIVALSLIVLPFAAYGIKGVLQELVEAQNNTNDQLEKVFKVLEEYSLR